MSDPRVAYVLSVVRRLILCEDVVHRDGSGVAAIIETMTDEFDSTVADGWRSEDIVSVVELMLTLVPERWLDAVVSRASKEAITQQEFVAAQQQEAA